MKYFLLTSLLCVLSAAAQTYHLDGIQTAIVPTDSHQSVANNNLRSNNVFQKHTQLNNCARQQVYSHHRSHIIDAQVQAHNAYFSPLRTTVEKSSKQLTQKLFDCPDDSRVTKRRQALDADQKSGHIFTAVEYPLNKNTHTLLTDFSYGPADFTLCIGTAIQQEIHQELVEIVTHLGDMHASKQQPPVEVRTMLEFVDTARELNTVGDVNRACTVTDFCWGLLDCGKAAIEGAIDGAAWAVNDMLEHPLQAAACIVAGEYVLAYQLAKVLYNVAELGVLAVVDPPASSKKWDDYVTPINAVIDAIDNKQLSLRDGIKAGTQLAVSWKAQSKALGGLSKFYKGVKTKAVACAKKRHAISPQEYMATPEGMVFKAAGEAPRANNTVPTTIYAQEIADKSSKTPVGKNGSIINVVTKNKSLTINGTKFTGHALDQMQARGVISPTAVLDVIAHPATTYAGNLPGTRVFIRDNLKIVTNAVGDIITVIPQ